jgi:hypothetical protein
MWIELLFQYYDGEYLIWSLVCKSWHKFLLNKAETKKINKKTVIALCSYNINIYKWARANGCPLSASICSQAANNGSLEVLQAARAEGCEWNCCVCMLAAASGHLEILQWARANGCPWDGYTRTAAAENGHLEVLQWAHDNGCPWKNAFAYEGSLVLQYHY